MHLIQKNYTCLSARKKSSFPISCLSPGVQSAECWQCSFLHMVISTPWTQIFSSFPPGKILHTRCSSAACDILYSNLQEMDVSKKLAQPYDWFSLMSLTIFKKAYSPEQLSYEHIILSWVFSRITNVCVCYDWGPFVPYLFDKLCLRESKLTVRVVLV